MKLIELDRITSGIDYEDLAWEVSKLLSTETETPRDCYIKHFNSVKTFHERREKIIGIAGEWIVTEIRAFDSAITVTLKRYKEA